MEEIKKTEELEKKIEHQLPEFEQRANSIKIASQDDLENATKLTVILDEKIKEVKSETEDMRKATHKAYQEVLDFRKKYIGKYQTALDIVKKKRLEYVTEQKRLEYEANRISEAKAREKEEKKRLELLAKAAKAKEKGKEELATELLSQSNNVIEIPVEKKFVENKIEVAGKKTTFYKDIEIEVTNRRALLSKVIDGLLPMSVVSINEAELKKFIKQHDNSEDISELPGWIKNDSGMRIRRTMREVVRRA